MSNPVLVIMAAGMGSRYGGLKQIDPVSDKGEIILDFSMYDAMKAGFTDVIFIIKKEHEEAFRNLMKKGAGRYLNIQYAFQELSDLPDGYSVPKGREKPWGTCHAVLSARNIIKGPFAVINADDYYGPGAFRQIYDFLADAKDDEKYRYTMVGYRLSNTLTENGYVSRGVCDVDSFGNLSGIVERTKIKWQGDKVVFTEDEGESWKELAKDTTVSMNFWGFTKSMMNEMERRFPEFLDKALVENPLKSEYYLPTAVKSLIDDDKAVVKVLTSGDRWYGVTYKDDKPGVVAALQAMKDKGIYPEKLWK